jgi:hypothetical protein
MLSLFNPWVILGVILALLGSFAGGYYKGELAEDTRHQIEIAAANDKARQTEQNMVVVANTYAQTLRKANNDAKTQTQKLYSDINNGTLKLRIPVKTPECAVSATADTTASSGSTETRAELDPAVAQSLVDLTSRGDQAIRSLNTCIDQYDEIRKMK